jgi:hypothetical protein
MINFRFHIISLVAVFLALALGVLFGSAVGEPAIVDTLHGQIDTARARANDLRRQNSDLRGQAKRMSEFVDSTSAFTVQNRLKNVDIVVIAERGVDDNPIDATVDLMREAGANVPAIIWLQQRWMLPEQGDVEALAEALGSSSTIADTVRVEGLNALARRVGRPVSALDADQPDVLQALVDANFITVDGADVPALASFPAHRSRALVVDGISSDIDDPVVFAACVTALKNRGVGTVAAEVGSDSPDAAAQRGDIVAAVRADDKLDRIVSTIDDLDLVQGRLTAVIALQQIAQGTAGDYGYGQGARTPVPEAVTQ